MEGLIQEWDLIDISINQVKYTWSNRRARKNNIPVRLGRFILHND